MKIFVIGLSRTGTTSTMAALTTLGYSSLHYPDTSDVVMKTLMGRFDWDVLDQYDAFGDAPCAAYYRELDAQCPGSKFILTTRNKDEWLRSCSLKIKNKGAYYSKRKIPRKAMLSKVVRASLYGRHYYDEQFFSRAYDRHVAEVTQYFVNRPGDLLVYDVKQRWLPLCEFLGHPVPGESFPHYTRHSGEFK